ncbi:hypothetical protein J7J95_00360 [bacterium]|nr:hypothetical protein [bacterium]
MNIVKLYRKLSNFFGKQGWWHADSLFEICAGIILVQQTTWKNAAEGIKNLKEKNLLKIEKIIHLPQSKLEKLLQPTGFYRQKARYLKEFARYVSENYHGDLKRWFEKPTEKLRKELLGIKGIGEESADSILLFAAEKPVFVVDAYTKRIFVRLGIVQEKASYSQIKEKVEKEIPPSLKDYKELRALLVLLGKKYCKTVPRCQECPLASGCPRAKQANKLLFNSKNEQH